MREKKLRQEVYAFDIGGTNMKYGSVSKEGIISNRGTINMKEIKDFDTLIEKMKALIPNELTKVAVSCPGFFAKDGMCTGGIENISYIEGKNIVTELIDKRENLEVKIINDGLAAATGEHIFGNGKGLETFITITLGTGIGCGIICEGRPYIGASGRSGEIGYWDYINTNKYFEQEWSTSAVIKKAEKFIGKKTDGLEFFSMIEEGRTDMIDVLEQWMMQLGKVIANIVLFFNPQAILIGGGISSSGNVFIDVLREKIRERLPECFKEDMKIELCGNKNDAGLLGAAALFAEED